MSAQDRSPEALLLRYFCGNSKSEPRDYMHTPHLVSGRVVATNGHWLGVLDQPTAELPPPRPSRDTYRPEVVLAAIDAYAGDFVPASSIGIKTERCPHCRGTCRATEVSCDECQGEGHFSHGSHEYKCNECQGDGIIVHRGIGATCTYCHGAGRSPTCAPSTHGDSVRRVSASGIYIAALRAMGGEISTSAVEFDGSRSLFILRFPGGRGALMPLSETKPLRIEESDLATSAPAAAGGAA